MFELVSSSSSRHGHKIVRAPRAVLTLLFFLSGCFSTHLSSFEPPRHLAELSESTAVHLPLEITNQFANQSRGYQFLLGLIPVSRVFPDVLSQMVTAKLITHAGFNNLGLAPVTQLRSRGFDQLPSVHVDITSVAVSGYDLILVRRPSAHISLEASLRTDTGTTRICHGEGDFAEFARYAFERELLNALDQAADSAARQVVECLMQQPSLLAPQSERNG
jgi:hypothetical protein